MDALEAYVADREARSPGFRNLVDEEAKAIREIDDLANVVLEQLDRQKVSQAELARRTGIAPSNLSRLLGGRGGNPTLETITRVADALDCDLVLVPRPTTAR